MSQERKRLNVEWIRSKILAAEAQGNDLYANYLRKKLQKLEDKGRHCTR